MVKREKMDPSESYAILKWASLPGSHGGNPYGMSHVKKAEHTVAQFEGRKPDSWAGCCKGVCHD